MRPVPELDRQKSELNPSCSSQQLRFILHPIWCDSDFIDTGADIPDEDERRSHRRPMLSCEDEQEDFMEMERIIHEKYAKSLNVECVEEATNLEQQGFLPSVQDPKLWMLKCAIGHEREVAVCLMLKCIDKGSEVQITSAIALDHLKNLYTSRHTKKPM